jgi:glycosyltransferase involved in cell wall biosynthesis
MNLRIAVYASPLRGISKPTGVGQHIANMAEHLAGREGINTSLLASRRDYEQVRPYLSQALAALPVHYLPRAERLLRTALISTKWVGIERWCGDVDWVYSPKEQPVATRRARLAVTVHDLLSFEPNVSGMERGVRPLASLRWRMLMRRILERGNLIAIVSEFTRRRLLELFKIREDERLVVIGNGVAPCYFRGRQPEDNEILKRHRLAPESYLIAVGSLTFRKGGDLLLDLALKLKERRLPWRIVVTGRRHDRTLLDRFHSLKSTVPNLPLDLTGYVSNEDQAVFLRNALALVFPSRYEGFGIPVLEAMACGTPVISSRAAALPEIAGDAALFVDVDQPEEWLERARSLADESRVRQQLIEAGRQRAAPFTWDQCASRLVAAMLRATDS